jgi:cytoskeleton protein RodZ
MSSPRRRAGRSRENEGSEPVRQESGPAAPPAQPPAGRGSFGQWLRSQRLARGIELAEIAEASKISLRYLDALEHDRFEILPAPVFVRGFLREYARVVGLDTDEVVNLFLVSAPRVAPERRADGASALRARPSPSRFGAVALAGGALALLVGAVAAVAYFALRRPDPAPEPAHAPGGPTAAALAPAPAEAPATETPVAPAPAVEPAPVPTARTASPALPPAPAPAPSADGGGLVVVLSFLQDCWIEVRVDGGRRRSELKAGGETLTLEARESIVLTLGNAPAVRAELNGRTLVLPADASRPLRDFRIDRSLLAPPAAPARSPTPGP